MVNRLISILKTFDDIDYKITETKIYGPESYYVKKQLEMSRFVDVTKIMLVVYRVFEEDGVKYRGSASVQIHPTLTDEEIKKAIETAAYAAGFVKNAYYPLVKGDGKKTVPQQASDQLAMLQGLKEAMYAEDRHEKGYLSYSEFFVKSHDVRIVNSEGVDISFPSASTFVETAVNWREGKEIEIYDSYTMAGGDAKVVSDGVSRLFTIASQKPMAEPTPALKDINVILTGESLRDFFGYYTDNTNTSMKYTGVSTFEVGQDLQPGAAGDRLSIVLDPELSGSSLSRRFDEDGYPLEKTEIIKDGKVKCFWGNLRFSSYLGIEPTGTIENMIVSGGSHKLVELKKEPYLELISLSGLQVDAVSGDFASEIRLAFYFDGEKTVPVTGGSISGSFKNINRSMKMSVETVQFNNYFGPAAISMKDITIAGAE